MASPRSKLLLVFGVLIVLSALGVGIYALHRHQHEKTESKNRNEQTDKGPKLYIFHVQTSAGIRDVTLPGEARPFLQAQLYARVNGYLRTLSVFPGDLVKRNQLLGTVDSPETDQQLASGKADQLVRNRNAERARQLTPAGVVPQQTLDQAEADLQSSDANLRRLRAFEEYEQLRAPFDGVVTQRYLDPGALVQPQVPVVEVTDATRIKVTVYVGQDVAPFLRVGDSVDIHQQERPDLKVEGKVTRMAGALDLRTRTMETEIWLDNTQFKLQAGTFVKVTLKVTTPPLPTVPNEATFVRGDQLMVGLLRDGRIHFQKVEAGINDGRNTQLRSGVQNGDQVLLNIPSDLDDGMPVDAEEPKKGSNKPGSPGAQPGDGASKKSDGGGQDGGSPEAGDTSRQGNQAQEKSGGSSDAGAAAPK